MIRRIVPSMLATLLAASSALAQTPNQFPAQTPSQVPTETQLQQPYESSAVARATSRAVPDVLFAAAAASGGLAEVNVSEIGFQHATDPELKRFSQQMIDDHTRLNHELTQLLAQKNLRVPQVIDARAQFCADSLAGLSGREFDKCYAKAQYVIHLDALSMFEAEAERGVDSEMKALAAKALPKIKEHLKMIKPIAKRYMMEEKSEPSAESRLEHSGTNH